MQTPQEMTREELEAEVLSLRTDLNVARQRLVIQNTTIDSLQAQVRRTYGVVNDYVPPAEDDYDR